MLWNTVYLERATAALRGNGRGLDAACCDASPLGEHINLTGNYLWRSSAKVGRWQVQAATTVVTRLPCFIFLFLRRPHQHVDDPEGARTTPLAGKDDTARLCSPDAADLGTRQSVRQVRSRHERPIGVDLIQMAAGDTTACSTPHHRLAWRVPILLARCAENLRDLLFLQPR